MLQNVIRSGVAFSHDPNTSAAYRVVNWSEGDDATFVTGGRAAVSGSKRCFACGAAKRIGRCAEPGRGVAFPIRRVAGGL